MTEKLIPFDLETYKREPERLRGIYGTRARESVLFKSGKMAIEWADGTIDFMRTIDEEDLRLAAKQETVNVFLVRQRETDPWAASTYNAFPEWRYVEGPYPLTVPK